MAEARGTEKANHITDFEKFFADHWAGAQGQKKRGEPEPAPGDLLHSRSIEGATPVEEIAPQAARHGCAVRATDRTARDHPPGHSGLRDKAVPAAPPCQVHASSAA